MVKYREGHKNSKGEDAPWCIISHDTGKVISSHKSREAAEKHLKDIQMFKHMKSESALSEYGVKSRTKDALDSFDQFERITWIPAEDGLKATALVRTAIYEGAEELGKLMARTLEILLKEYRVSGVARKCVDSDAPSHEGQWCIDLDFKKKEDVEESRDVESEKQMSIEEALEVLESSGKLVTEGYIDLFGLGRVDRKDLNRSKVGKINAAKAAIKRYLDSERYTEAADYRDIRYEIRDLRDAGALDALNMSDEEFMDRVGITDQMELFREQREEFKKRSREIKSELEDELIREADMKIIDEPHEYRTVIAYKDIDPSSVKFKIAWSNGYEDGGILPRITGLYNHGWVDLGYGTLGHLENAPKIPSWTVEDSNSKNWPVKADAETLKEIHDFLKEHPEDMEAAIREHKSQEAEIARDIQNYKGRNWSGD